MAPHTSTLALRNDLPIASPRSSSLANRARKAGLSALRSQPEPQSQHDLLELVAAQEASGPERSAAQFGEQSLSYAELERRSNQLAQLLVQVGVGADVLVAIHLSRSHDLLVSMLAVLKAGGAYLPLDPSNPPQRNRAILEDARPGVVIESAATRLSDTRGETMHICLDDDRDCIACFPASAPTVEISPEQLAYVIFTSGSTGRPKGVQNTRAGLTNYVRAMAREPGLSAGERSLALATVSFDMSVFDFWMPLCVGGCMVIGDEGLAQDVERLKQRLERGDIGFLHATPTTLRMLIDAGWRGQRGMRALSGGEALSRELASAILTRVDALYNGYGPTEGTVCATLWQVDAASPISIGQAVDNMRTYVLDSERQLLSGACEGELWIAGAGLARGYLGRPDLTAERFVRDPFDGRAGERMYRTGDLVRRDERGQLFFIARADDQVKLRGFRIELGEIEAVLETAPGVQAAVVKLHRDARTGVEQLAAFYTSAAEIDVHGLRAHACAQLPKYMVPSSVDRIAELPRMPSGKLDRRALPDPQPVKRGALGGDLPSNDLECAVASVFAELFNQEQIAASDDFFELGGSSLLALRFQAALELRTGQPFALKHLFERRSVRGIAEALAEAQPQSGATVLALNPNGTRAPVFCLLGIYHYQALADALRDVDRPWYGVYVPSEETLFRPIRSGEAPSVTLQSLAAQYVEAIRKRQPHGPYCLVGHSTGGVVAFEAARQLRAAGEEVEQLVLLDTVLESGIARSARESARHALRMLRRRWLRFSLASRLSAARKRSQGRALSTEERAAQQSLEQSLQQLQHIHAYEVAEKHWAEHEAGAYTGSAVFVHASGRSEPCGEVEPTAGWGALVQGGVLVREMPGEHADMVRAPNVAQLAELLRPLL
jgi:amino acid adenylation domain-containing protein